MTAGSPPHELGMAPNGGLAGWAIFDRRQDRCASTLKLEMDFTVSARPHRVSTVGRRRVPVRRYRQVDGSDVVLKIPEVT